MKKPEIEVVRFGAEDVIATSGAPKLVTWSKLGGTKGDSIVSFGDNTYDSDPDSHSDSEIPNILTALGNYYEWSASPSRTNVRFSTDSGSLYKTLANLWTDDDAPSWAIIPPAYNGSYTFDSNKSSGSGYYWFFKQ